MANQQENKEYLDAYRLFILDKCRLKEATIDSKYFDSSEFDFDPCNRSHLNKILQKIHPESKDPAKHVYNILIGKTKNFTSRPLVELAARLGIINYNDFVDNKEFLERYRIEKSNHRKNQHAGLYFIYACSSYRKGLVRYPLLIHADGNAELKTSGNSSVKGKTRLIHEDKYLVLDFLEYQGIGAFMGTFIFYIRDIHSDFGPGVSMRLNDKFKPQAKREFLSLHEAANTNFDKSVSEFQKCEFEYFYPGSPRFEKLIKINEGMQTLLGREYNLITQKINNTKSGNLFRREEFDKLYLSQALFEFLRDEIDTPLVGYYFELAMEHGLFIGDRYKNLLNDLFHVLKVDHAKQQTIRNAFDKHYEETRIQYNKNRNNVHDGR